MQERTEKEIDFIHEELKDIKRSLGDISVTIGGLDRMWNLFSKVFDENDKLKELIHEETKNRMREDEITRAQTADKITARDRMFLSGCVAFIMSIIAAAYKIKG